MSVKVICIGDPHFKDNNIPEIKEFIHKSIQLTKKEMPDFVVILGDLLDKHEKYLEEPFNLAMQWLWDLQEITYVFLVIGNHDLRNNKQFLTPTHAFNPCKTWKNITVCDNVVIRDVNGMRFTFVPYVYPGRFLEALESSQEVWETSECIFAHQEFRGCTLSGTQVSTMGDVWDSSNPRVISGHIHDSQIIPPKDESDSGYIYYPGASMQHAFGEADNKATWLCKFFEDEDFSYQKMDLGLPKRIIHRMDINSLDKDFVEKLTETRDKHKLKLTASKEDITLFRKGSLFKFINKQKNIVLDFEVIGLHESLLSQKIDKKIKGNYTEILHSLVKQENNKELNDLLEDITRGL